MNPEHTLIALTYTDGASADRVLREVADRLRGTGARLAGVVQRDDPIPNRARCDMVLESLSGGESILISEDRGPSARGCRLVVGELLRAMNLMVTALCDRPDLLILNKFGKTEAEGGGFRAVIAQAMELGVPVLVAVPDRNVDSWRDFTGDLAREIRLDTIDRAVTTIMRLLTDDCRLAA